ncbi:phage tail terminator-like protein [Pseudomonas sp. DTU_2021_1001937_2_SI_NGA_ILE_001]|uniref:phage tail terminator-like protein n=1 Tax=Pseudomonas sp. DTU_2021_1001937_2_SI_NGA_ILE_001 TaxID=3077589 RepID=UPI0028FC2DD8|nr:phage tail terminator-like protein [Pseudomonas sp. DTU_2021_1001937_2_SI_NGA_ILE_001]WNW10127.1 phage tail terminator-like protein [Pseudomonas sp. DTU_2021_1001937_2_SI_NGA_ILE_001]
MSHARARRAIEALLAPWADALGLPVAYGAEPFEPPQGIYIHGFLLPASTTSRYLGSDAYEYRGIYQFNIICPMDEPISAPEALVDALSALFPVDAELARAGFEGQVLSPVEQGPTVKEADRYTIPVSFTYIGQAPREGT